MPQLLMENEKLKRINVYGKDPAFELHMDLNLQSEVR